MPFAYISTNGNIQDSSFLFAAFVDENNPSIDRLLHEALRFNAVKQFKGYQGSADEVMREAFAIWNVLQRQGVTYSSITTPSGQSPVVLSEHVRFLDESVENSQANCVDGTVLFASVLYKLGIYPLLVRLPGHMFLGFYTDAQRKQAVFLETTLIGSPGLNRLEREHVFLTANGYLLSESYKQFSSAMQVGNDEFQKAAKEIRSKTPEYLIIDIEAARRAGVSAIPRF